MEIDLLTEDTMEIFDDILSLKFEEQFGLFINLAEALSERDLTDFTTNLAKWSHAALEDKERWDNLRKAVVVALKTSPNEIQSLFMAIED
jgi:hypothetical protein